MFKLTLAIILIIMYMAPLVEQALIVHTQGLFVCNIRILSSSFREEDFQRFAFNLL